MLITEQQPETVTTRIPLLPKQRQFILAGTKQGEEFYSINPKVKEILYAGAAGSGKTRALCIKLYLNALTPGTTHALFRKTNATITNTTLRTLLHGEDNLPPVIPYGTYRHNISGQRIDLNGGGTIIYMGLDAPKKGAPPQKIGSLNLSSVAIDESIEITEADYDLILTRIRQDTGSRQVYMATNPASPSHWIYKRFFEQPHPSRHCIQCKTIDNKFLPPDYVQHLETLSGQMYKRYVLGQWIAFEGLIFGDDWSRERNILRKTANGYENEVGQQFSLEAFDLNAAVTGADAGYTNPAAFIPLHLDGDGRALITKEYYHTKKKHSQLAADAKTFCGGRGVWAVDPAEPGLIDEMKALGLEAKSANNAVSKGINMVMQRMGAWKTGDEKPRLFVRDTCLNFIREVETYAWNEIKDAPIKEADHTQDAMRYGIMDIDAGSKSIAYL